jgi:membrane-associated phospholipid phosphatase
MQRGAWRPFANLGDYAKNTPKYDAFPSGHLATAMATVTVIAANYPDNPWVKRVGYSLMGACAFSMMNDGVHWASDYPLALLIGGTVGRMAAERGRPQTPAAEASRIEPLVSPAALGLRVSW